ncbi:hypothetical protein HAV38_04100 [Glaciimonas immobilis]|nr:hypothetical protein HAV38_04100 [Glaciimonas immobilis]
MTIFDKTTRGRAEIAVRGHNLTPRLRTLLLLIDGKTESTAVLTKVAGLGLTATHLDVLFETGLIEIHASRANPSTVSATSIPPNTVNIAPPLQPISTAAPAQPVEEVGSILPPGQSQFEAIYRFYNETIKSMIGLRGYGLQLKVERAGSIDDFKELRQLYLEAIFKSKGKETTRSLRDRLDKLLYLGQPGPNSIHLE